MVKSNGDDPVQVSHNMRCCCYVQISRPAKGHCIQKTKTDQFISLFPIQGNKAPKTEGITECERI